ncbi:MAG: hypothetical protein ACRDKD_03095 [Solirubrobacteraceae bacterium]
MPPRNPASDCNGGAGMGVGAINACRAQEGIGPLRLPSNWGSLTPVQQGFVLINLERVNRGLPAIVGLSAPLNGLASAGAAGSSDPSFPAGGFVGGGGIWAGSPSVLAADYLWMYVDGPGGDNLDCAAAGDTGCWGHRDIILWDKTSGLLVSGGGFASAGGTDSLAYLVLSGYSTANLTFTWAGELEHFASKPGVEPLGKVASARRHGKTKHRHHALKHHARHRRQHAGTASSGSASSSSSSGPSITIG